jgi:hypothetical protein
MPFDTLDLVLEEELAPRWHMRAQVACYAICAVPCWAYCAFAATMLARGPSVLSTIGVSIMIAMGSSCPPPLRGAGRTPSIR